MRAVSEQDASHPQPPQTTVHDVVGSDFFVELVDRFYDGVDSDPRLRPMYPQDLTGARARLAAFLVQYWGGPTTYSDARGHPRLRMRHMPFPIDETARNAWLEHMLAALDAMEAPDPVPAMIRDYFVRSADFLRNTE